MPLYMTLPFAVTALFEIVDRRCRTEAWEHHSSFLLES